MYLNTCTVEEYYCIDYVIVGWGGGGNSGAGLQARGRGMGRRGQLCRFWVVLLFLSFFLSLLIIN
jgi:hypothetical protein